MNNLLKVLIIAALSLIFTHPSYADKTKVIKVAVIDTGFDFKSSWKGVVDSNGVFIGKPKLCKDGHKDFTGTTMQDNLGHGTHIAGLIGAYAKGADYCLTILKAYTGYNTLNGVLNTIKAIEYATKLKVDIINLSAGGIGFYINEYLAVKAALNSGIIFVSAAGNYGKKTDFYILKTIDNNLTYINRSISLVTMSVRYIYFPANYDPRIVSVGNITTSGSIHTTSNYGAAVSHYEVGVNALSIVPSGKYERMTGTSQSTAIKTGKIVNMWRRY